MCYEKLDLLSEGIRWVGMVSYLLHLTPEVVMFHLTPGPRWSEKALEREEAAPQELRAR